MDFLSILDSTDIGRGMQLIYEGSICAQSGTIKIDMTRISLPKNLKVCHTEEIYKGWTACHPTYSVLDISSQMGGICLFLKKKKTTPPYS